MGLYLHPSCDSSPDLGESLVLDHGGKFVSLREAERCVLAMDYPPRPTDVTEVVLIVFQNPGFQSCGWLFSEREFRRATEPVRKGFDHRPCDFVVARWGDVVDLFDHDVEPYLAEL